MSATQVVRQRLRVREPASRTFEDRLCLRLPWLADASSAWSPVLEVRNFPLDRLARDHDIAAEMVAEEPGRHPALATRSGTGRASCDRRPDERG
jgi:hypothetical protein